MLFPTSLTIPPPFSPPTGNYTFPIKADDAIKTLWPTLRPRVLKIIERLSWCTLSVFNLGPTEESAKPTIVIGVENAYADSVRPRWDKVRVEIEKVLQEEGAGWVGVVVREDGIFCGNEIY